MSGGQVEVVEVGMRDGFQMEQRILPTREKQRIGLMLIDAGLRHIEATSFVSPRAIPQSADAAALVAAMKGRGAEISALVPTVSGARRALDAGVDRITVFASASETHNQANVRHSVGESLAALAEIGSLAESRGQPITGAVATAFGCPFEGEVATEAVLRVVDGYVAVGADSVVLGDTTGMATPPVVERVVAAIRAHHPALDLRLHFHNTRGLGLVNVAKALELGVRRFDASVGGLGGCPFAPGASGNVATEDLAFLLDETGWASGLDLSRLIKAAQAVQALLGRPLPGQVMKAGPRLSRPDLS
jgi:hydroxymethylglutaryl-CoA lyase